MMKTTEELLQLEKPDPELVETLKNGSPLPSIPPQVEAYRSFLSRFQTVREQRVGATPPGVIETDHQVPTRDGSTITVRQHSPANYPAQGSPSIVIFHGGGFCLGDLLSETPLCRRLVLELSAVVLNVDYRLAPEHPFPTAIYDSWDALQWAVKNAAALHANPKAGFIVGGVSAGANISAVLAHMALDEHLNPPLTGQFLSVGSYIGPMNVPDNYKPQYLSWEQCKDNVILSEEVQKMFMTNYKADYNSPLRYPYFHPRGHSDQPPAYFQICGADMLRGESFIYEQELRKCDVETRMDVYPGLPHVFWDYFSGISAAKKRAVDTIEGFRWLLERGRAHQSS